MEVDNPPPEPNSNFSKFCNLIKIVLFFALFCFLISCFKQREETYQKKFSNSLLKEAKYSDIPIPLACEFIDPNNFYMVSNNSLENLIDFYLKNMEIFGWDIKNYSDDREGLLICDKLSRSCAISIRYDKNKKVRSRIRIFIKEKTPSHDGELKDINSKRLGVLAI